MDMTMNGSDEGAEITMDICSKDFSEMKKSSKKVKKPKNRYWKDELIKKLNWKILQLKRKIKRMKRNRCCKVSEIPVGQLEQPFSETQANTYQGPRLSEPFKPEEGETDDFMQIDSDAEVQKAINGGVTISLPNLKPTSDLILDDTASAAVNILTDTTTQAQIAAHEIISTILVDSAPLLDHQNDNSHVQSFSIALLTTSPPNHNKPAKSDKSIGRKNQSKWKGQVGHVRCSVPVYPVGILMSNQSNRLYPIEERSAEVSEPGICFLDPIVMKDAKKTGRTLTLCDWFGGPITLVMNSFPKITSKVLKAQLRYRFSDGANALYLLNVDEVTITNKTQEVASTVQMFEITNLKAKKETDRDAAKTLRASPPKQTTPNASISPQCKKGSGRQKTTNKSILESHRAKKPRLILMFGEHELTSNLLFPEQSDCYFGLNLQYKILPPDRCSDGNSLYLIHVFGQIPESLVCTLRSGFKWLEIALITYNERSPIYYFINDNDSKFDMLYHKITSKHISECFRVGRLTWEEIKQNIALRDKVKASYPTADWADHQVLENKLKDYLTTEKKYNHFHVQIRLVHSENLEDSYKLGRLQSYKETLPIISDEITDNKDDLFSNQSLPVIYVNKKNVMVEQ